MNDDFPTVYDVRSTCNISYLSRLTVCRSDEFYCVYRMEVNLSSEEFVWSQGDNRRETRREISGFEIYESLVQKRHEMSAKSTQMVTEPNPSSFQRLAGQETRHCLRE